MTKEDFIAQTKDAARELHEHNTAEGFWVKGPVVGDRCFTGELVAFRGRSQPHASLELHGLSLEEVGLIFRVLRTGYGG